MIGVPNWFNAASQDKRLVGKDMSHILMAISGGAKNSIIGKKTDDEFLMSVNARCIETNGHGMSEICGSGSYQFKNQQHLMIVSFCLFSNQKLSLKFSTS